MMNAFLHDTVRFSTIIIMCSSFVVSGCSQRVADASQAMSEIQNSDAQDIEPIPEPEIIEDYVYSADSKVRSPFLPPSMLGLQNQVKQNQGIRPDATRVKEQLEEYPLTQLTFKGMIVSPNGEQFGLVQRPDGTIASVRVGDHIGLDYGRIVEITPSQINLIEIVPDSRSGFVEKPQSLVSPFS